MIIQHQLQRSVGTHDGTFHCDESLACYMLTRHTKQYYNYSIIRTRNNELINKLPIVVDVGAVYNVNLYRFDHHQRTFNETFDDKHDVKLSSAGLIYKHYGIEIIGSIITRHNKLNNIDAEIDEHDVKLIHLQVYDNFIQAIDGIDNGIPQYNTASPPNYKSMTDISSRVAALNPSWNQPSDDNILYKQFLKAVELTGAEFSDCVIYMYNVWLPARNIVLNSFQNRLNIHPSGEILLLDQYTVWKSHIFQIESEYNCIGEIKYVIYGDPNNTYRVQCMPLNDSGFDNRLSLPEQWRGIRDQQLSQLTGIPDCVFVHATGFIGGNQTKQGALQMASKSLELAQRNKNI